MGALTGADADEGALTELDAEAEAALDVVLSDPKNEASAGADGSNESTGLVEASAAITATVAAARTGEDPGESEVDYEEIYDDIINGIIGGNEIDGGDGFVRDSSS